MCKNLLLDKTFSDATSWKNFSNWWYEKSQSVHSHWRSILSQSVLLRVSHPPFFRNINHCQLWIMMYISAVNLPYHPSSLTLMILPQPIFLNFCTVWIMKITFVFPDLGSKWSIKILTAKNSIFRWWVPVSCILRA